jgi:hypothetical protein
MPTKSIVDVIYDLQRLLAVVVCIFVTLKYDRDILKITVTTFRKL